MGKEACFAAGGQQKKFVVSPQGVKVVSGGSTDGPRQGGGCPAQVARSETTDRDGAAAPLTDAHLNLPGLSTGFRSGFPLPSTSTSTPRLEGEASATLRRARRSVRRAPTIRPVQRGARRHEWCFIRKRCDEHRRRNRRTLPIFSPNR